MRLMKRFGSMAVVTLLAVMLMAGCDNSGGNASSGGRAKTETASTPEPPKPPAQPIIPVTQIADWCPEHGVPESICSRCNASLIAGFKEKGDWCKEHDLPESQCFKCHPELQAKFAAAFKEKYGKDPAPMPSESAK